MQRAELFTGHNGRFSGPGRFQGTVGINSYEGVDLLVQGLNSSQDGLDDIDRRYVPGSDCGGQLRGRR